MSVSTATVGCPSGLAPPEAASHSQDPSVFVTESRGRKALDVMVRGARCGGCLSKIEKAVKDLRGVEAVRLNLSTGKLRVEWVGDLPARHIVEAITELGYGAAAYDPGTANDDEIRAERRLLIAMLVAGVATAGVMLMSEAIWFGADMTPETRTLLHWLSAAIAIPASAYAGRAFFESALASIRRRRLNMDVPISLAVILAIGLSVFETMRGGEHAYFDASVMLLFFLLIGRFLDARLRRRVYAAANALASSATASATRLRADGAAEAVRAADIEPGDVLLLAVGEKLVVNAEVVSGGATVDLRLVTGETEPVRVFNGQTLQAGAVNLDAPLRVRALASADRSLTAEIARLLEAGEQKKSSYRRIADRMAEAYVPQVHAMAAFGFVAWLLVGASPVQALFVAMTVLIITCPCALALAAPMVQVVAAGRLFRNGVFLGSGDALERIAEVDFVLFDKTGTLTLGDPVLVADVDRDRLETAAQLARASRHPFSRAIVRAAGPGIVAEDVVEHPGKGVSGLVNGRRARLGSAAFAGGDSLDSSALWFSFEGENAAPFHFEDALRDDARDTVRNLQRMGLGVELLSGDSSERVQRAAKAAGIELWTANATPQSKAAYLEKLQALGHKVLMVGDGLNDAGALACAHASLAPGAAVDVSRLAADCVYPGARLAVIVDIIEIAREARRRIRENFAFSIAYNVVAIPIALIGWATPLVAAVAMSASSAVVTLNALRLAKVGRQRQEEIP